MSTGLHIGIASRQRIEAGWIRRALTSAGYLDVTEEPDGRLSVATEVGVVSMEGVQSTGLLRFTALAGEAFVIPDDSIERHAVVRRALERMDLARLSIYGDEDGETALVEYEMSILAGLSRPQFLQLLRYFLKDLATLRQ